MAEKTPGDKCAELQRQLLSLQHEKACLEDELDSINVLNAKLQMDMARQQRENAHLQELREDLTREITNITIRTPAARSKVETVTFLAEATTEIKAVKATAHPDDAAFLVRAEMLLDESNLELEKGDYAQSYLLASQAMTLVNKLRFMETPKKRNGAEPYSEFIRPIKLKLIKQSHVRSSPGTSRKPVTVVAEGSEVTAAGYKGEWIKVSLPDGREGWIYYSLLSVPKELEKMSSGSSAE